METTRNSRRVRRAVIAAVAVFLLLILCLLRFGGGEKKYISISFDDTIELFRDLAEHDYASIFENDTLAYLQDLHLRYGACFTMYCYYENGAKDFNLSRMPDRYSQEFTENADWLKWGFHTYNADTLYTEENEARAGEDYRLIVSQLLRITGSEKCLERIVRLQSYAGTKAAIDSLVACDDGILGLLGPDDGRNAYFLTGEESRYLRETGSCELDGIRFLSTDFRLENYLDSHYPSISGEDSALIVFSHEWILDDPELRSMLTALCREAIQKGYQFSFPIL